MKDLISMAWWLCELTPTTCYSHNLSDPWTTEQYSYVVLPVGENWGKWVDQLCILNSQE